MEINSYISAIKDHHRYKYVKYHEAFINYFTSIGTSYNSINVRELKLYKKSDTLFILGSGPSLNKLSSDQIEHINYHDSFGINYSFLKADIIPTYHHFGWHRNRYNRWKLLFSPYREKYKNVVIMMHKKSLYRRLTHPRLTPFLFPFNPTIFIYDVPEAIIVKENKMITNAQFEKSLLYRGSMSLALDIAKNMGYKKIVLLGVDLDTQEHFWDQHPMMTIDKNTRLLQNKESNLGSMFESQYPKNNKAIPFDRYLYSLSKYLINEKNITLYCGLDNKITSKFMPTYFNIFK